MQRADASRPGSRDEHRAPVSAQAHSCRAIYLEHAATVRRFLLSMGVDREAVDDVSQDVFLQAFRYLPGFRGDCSIKSWLYRICASEARRSRRRSHLRRRVLSLLSIQTHAETRGELGERRAQWLVQQALDCLSEPERVVFVLYELEAVPGKQIAEVCDCPESTVWRRLHFARKKFKDFIAAHGGTP